MTEALREHVRRAERLLQRDLLVQHHADEQRQRVRRQQLVGLGVDGQRKRHGPHPMDFPQADS
jgi:hypothetical protein